MFDSLKKKLASIKKKDSERIEEPISEEPSYLDEIVEESIEEPEDEPLPPEPVESSVEDEDDFTDDDFWDDEAFWKNDKFFEDVPEDEEDFEEEVKKPAPKKEPVYKEKPVVEKQPKKEPKESFFEKRIKSEKSSPPTVKAQPSVKPEEKPSKPVEEPKPKAVVEETKVETPSEPAKKGLFSKRAEKKQETATVVATTKAARKVEKDDIESILWDLEIGLLESDVALSVIDAIKEGVQNVLSERKIERGENLGDVVEEALRSAIGGVLQSNEFDFDKFVDECEKPAVVMFVGINGTGKTTSIAKLANRLQKNGKTVVLAASDTFRAGAIEQLTIHSDNLGIKIIKHQSGADPAAVAYDAVEHAKSKHKDVVLVDTAGRMQTNSNLMDEMKKIKRVVKPDLVVFVGDALAGNDAVEQARAFNEAIGLDAIILTKIDADAKGGAALSIAHSIGKPIAFLSTGQEYEDIIKFDSNWMLERLFSD